MNRITFTTGGVPELERFAFWREAVLEDLIGAVGERSAEPARPFRAEVTCWDGPAFRRLRYQSDAHQALRRPQDIARKSWDAYWINREISGNMRYDLSGREFVTRSGDLTVTDSDLPLRAQTRDGSTVDFDVWVIPRAMLEPHLPARGGPISLTLPGKSGLKTLATSYLDSLGQRLDALSDAEAGQAADILCRLVAVACGAASPGQRDAMRTARLAQIKRHVDLHLTEIELTPAKVAKALRISVRSLHLAFEPTGTSFAEHVMRRRVQECRTALAQPGSTRSVTDVAFAWGFANLTTFYRAFRREFGVAPGDVRPVSA